MKHHVVACVVAVAMAATLVGGQSAARSNNNAAAPGAGARLDVSIPQLIAYQGKLTDSTGRPVDDGSYVMILSLSADSTGSSFWHETQTVETQGGLFNILLGSKVPISVSTMPQGGCYLGIRVLPATQEFRRQRIVSVPFAFQADNSDKLQGRDSAALDGVYLSHTDTNAVTTVLIADSTIARIDVAPGFTAPYADTADYARLASDSARVAATAHLLQGTDTSALWNAKTLQGKDTAGFVRTGQPDAVSSAMIVPNTIVRADVANNFKAPYADTADYATSAPATDSARVAGNSHLLQTKDTAALWNAKTLQGRDTTALSNAKTLQGKDTTALWNAKFLQGKDTAGFVRTNQANSISSVMIANGTVVRADVANNFKAPYADTADYATSAPAADSARVAGNSHLLLGKDTAALWNAKTLQGKDTSSLWNAKTLQGKDTTGFVRAGQGNSITSAMITNGEVQTPDIADANVTAVKVAANAIDSTKIVDGSVVGADIKDRSITSSDLSKTGVVPGTYGDGYHVARITVDSAGLLTSVSDSTILGASPTGPAGGDLAGNYPNPTIAADKVTSAKILNGTIVRADVATNFKAPYADTADYATSAPASDSARVAGNSYLLLGKDTTALWNAKTLQGKDTTGFVRAGQPDAVSSAMIVPNTIVRSDVATSFKAPYSDTADYATLAPASDSARVAGNSYLLLGKDTIALWNAKTLQDKDTTALWNAKKLQGKDTTGFVRTGQPDAVTSAMVVDGTIVRGDVAAGFKAPFSDTADYARAAPASDSARVAGNSYLLLGKDTTALWNAKTLQGKDSSDFLRTGQADAVSSAMIVNGTIVRNDVAAGFKAPYADTADYANGVPAADSARVAGNSHLLQNKDTTALWNAKTLQGKDTTVLWNAKTLQGKDTTGFVRTGQAGSITSGMIADNNVTLSKTERGTSSDSGKAIVSQGLGSNPVWGYPSALGNTSPTTMQSFRFGTVNVDFPSTSGPAFVETTATITGAAIGDLVFVTSTSGFNANFILCATCEVTSANTIRLRAYLPGSSTIDPDADNMRFVLIKP